MHWPFLDIRRRSSASWGPSNLAWPSACFAVLPRSACVLAVTVHTNRATFLHASHFIHRTTSYFAVYHIVNGDIQLNYQKAQVPQHQPVYRIAARLFGEFIVILECRPAARTQDGELTNGFPESASVFWMPPSRASIRGLRTCVSFIDDDVTEGP